MTYGIGHNTKDYPIRVEVRLFNSLQKFAGPEGWRTNLEVTEGATVGDIVARLGVPKHEIYLVMRNGRDISSGLIDDPVNFEASLDDGDVIAFLGPVPYSYGYGAPIV